MIPILHLRTTSGLYGAERVVLALGESTPAPFQPHVAVVARSSPPLLAAEARRRGLEVLELPSRSLTDFPLVKSLAQAVRQHGIAVLHAHDYKSLVLALLAGEWTGVPVVATYHGDTQASFSVAAYERFAHLCGNLARVCVAVSKTLEERLRRVAIASRIVRIPNGIAPVEPITDVERRDARAALGVAPSTFVVAIIGRLSREKGHSLLIEALRSMRQPPLTLVAGDGPARAAIEGPARFLPVRMLGFVADPRPVHAACDAVVLPSLSEGLPLVVLEAMALGKPVVATSVGELPEVLGDAAGLIVPPNDPRALANALEHLRANTRARREMAERAKRRVAERYSAQAMGQAYAEQVYAPLVATKRVIQAVGS